MASKEDVAWKIWDGEGLDYYFVNWTGPELEHIKEVVTEDQWKRLKERAAAFLKARTELADELEAVGLGPYPEDT